MLPPLVSKRSVRAIHLVGFACGALSLVPLSVLEPSARSASQCLLAMCVIALVAATEVWRDDSGTGRAPRVFARTCAAAMPVMLAAVILAAVSGPCEPLAAIWNAGWALLPTVLLAAALGVFAGSCSRSPPLMVASLVTPATALWLHDLGWSNLSVSYLAFDHLGLWSVEDSAGASRIYIRAEAVASRVGTLAWASLFVAVAPEPGSSRWHAWSRALGGPLVAAALFGALGLFAGIVQTHGTLTARLGAEKTLPGFRLVYDEHITVSERERFEEDLLFHRHQLAPLFDAQEEPPVHVYLYSSFDQYDRLVGAPPDAFALPHRRTLHVVVASSPHPVLRHELIHVLAGSWTKNPWRVPGEGAWGGPDHAGLVEGLAEAMGIPEDPRIALHEPAAALHATTGTAIRRVMAPDGFTSVAMDRAYTVAGSFVRFLIDTRGLERVRRLYAHGDYAAAMGQSLEELAAEWERHLAGIEVPPHVATAVAERYDVAEPWSHVCWREAEACKEEAANVSVREEVVDLYLRCLRARPDDAFCLLGVAREQVRGLDENAARSLMKLRSQDAGRTPRDAEVSLLLAQQAFVRGDLHDGAAFAREAVRVDSAPWLQLEGHIFSRMAMHAGADELYEVLWPSDRERALATIRRVYGDEPTDLSAQVYLWWMDPSRWPPIGRRLASSEQDMEMEAVPRTARDLLTEQLVQAAWRGGDCTTVEAILARHFDAHPRREGFASHMRQRCAFRHRAPSVEGVAGDSL